MKCPTGKITFTTRISAWQVAIKKGNEYNHKLVPYHCPICKRIHLTKRDDTVKGSTIPHKVGARINLETGELAVKRKKRKYKKPKVYINTKSFYQEQYTKQKMEKIPEWKKKILRLVLRLLRIKT